MINRPALLLNFVYALCMAASVVVAQTSSPVSPPSETSFIPPLLWPLAVAIPCHWTGNALNSNGCSDQAEYLITEISPILCPAGSFYAPSGVVSVSVAGTGFNSLCPATPQPAELCKTGPVPALCSDASKKIASIPYACGNEQYYGNSGFLFDGNGCPVVAVSPAAPAASGRGTSSGSYLNGPCFGDGSGHTLTATGCSAQAAYFINQLTPIFCPAGSTFAPNSVTVVGGALCPVPFSSLQINCKLRPIPSACCESAIKIANILDLCGADLYISILMTGTDTNGCPLHTVLSASPSGSVTSAHVPQPSASDIESNLLHLDFKTRHLCNLQPHGTRLVTRDFLAQNGMGVLFSDTMSQCSMLGSDATAASHDVCKLLILEWQTINSIKLESYHESLAVQKTIVRCRKTNTTRHCFFPQTNLSYSIVSRMHRINNLNSHIHFVDTLVVLFACFGAIVQMICMNDYIHSAYVMFVIFLSLCAKRRSWSSFIYARWSMNLKRMLKWMARAALVAIMSTSPLSVNGLGVSALFSQCALDTD